MNRFRPTASDRKEKKVTNQFSLHSVEVSNTSESSWKELVGKDIFFWSWTIGRINETARTRVFIFHTLKNVGFYRIQKLLNKRYPDWEVDRWTPFKFGKGVGFQIPYGVSHAIEVRVPEPTPWLDVMEKTTVGLEKELRVEEMKR
jgi:hypothetical protein